MGDVQTQPSQIRIEAGRWPLLVVRFVGELTENDFGQYLNDMTELLYEPGERVLIYDATECGPVRASIRRMQGEWMKAHAARIRKDTLGIAFVIPSAFIRGALTAIFWIAPLEAPHAIVKDMPHAVEQCRAWLDQRGISLDASRTHA